MIVSSVVNSHQSYFVAETKMPGRSGFDFNGSSQSFNVLAFPYYETNSKKWLLSLSTSSINLSTVGSDSNGYTSVLTHHGPGGLLMLDKSRRFQRIHLPLGCRGGTTHGEEGTR
jgi:hypothetical protein